LKKVQPDKLNTREVTFDIVPGQEYSQAVVETLRFEILMLEHDAKQGFITLMKKSFASKNLKTLEVDCFRRSFPFFVLSFYSLFIISQDIIDKRVKYHKIQPSFYA